MELRRKLLRACLYMDYGLRRLTGSGPFGPRQAVPVTENPPGIIAGLLQQALWHHYVKQFNEAACSVASVATVINALGLQDTLEQMGTPTRVQTAIHMSQVAEPYILRRALRHLEKGRVVIFAAGSGNPYFTTDTAAVLRAKEIHAQILLKATKVNGLYDSDPERNTDARFIETISYMEVLERQLKVMDMTAISLAMDNDLPLMVFNLKEKGNIRKVVVGEDVGTTIGGQSSN